MATGIGITPILCILKDLVNSNYDGKVTFIYGARTQSELFYLNDIKNVEKENENVELISVLSREKLDGSYTGYVTDIIKEMDLNNKHICMCCLRAVASWFRKVIESY